MKLLVFIFLFFAVIAYSQIPPGYYTSAEGLSGQPLRASLHDIIDDHQAQSYASIWTHFQTTDDNPQNKVWDMYSDIPGGNPAYLYNFISDQCGNYSAEGDCYNREHSFPQDWFNGAAPMVTDLFHIYPVDGYVNGKRGSYPYGEVGNATWSSSNGSMIGNSSFTGYSEVVFEPVDEYKGDFARTYFYMLTRYMEKISGWQSEMLSGDNFSEWAKDLLLQWHNSDPVSQKETDRNNSVYSIQDNRNPFIDHPEFSELIWGDPNQAEEFYQEGLVLYIAGNILHISNAGNISGTLTIYSITGQQLKTFMAGPGSNQFVLNLDCGFYIAILLSGKQDVNYKFIISHHN